MAEFGERLVEQALRRPRLHEIDPGVRDGGGRIRELLTQFVQDRFDATWICARRPLEIMGHVVVSEDARPCGGESAGDRESDPGASADAGD